MHDLDDREQLLRSGEDKIEDSDVRWREMDQKYHFSCQFTADMISMNTSDFIITSTYQEIAGRSVAKAEIVSL